MFKPRFAVAALLAFVLNFQHGRALADSFPDRPITIIVPAQAGGGTDVLFRKLAEAVKLTSGHTVIVLNRPGASATLAVGMVVRTQPDGYTVGGVWNGPLTMAPLVIKVSYTPSSYEPIIRVANSPVVLCVRADFPASNTREFVNLIRQNPGKYTYGTDGVGNTVQFAVTRAFQTLGVSAKAIPFNTSGATVQSFLSSVIDIYGGSLVAIKPAMDARSAKCLFVTTAKSNHKVPDAEGLDSLGAGSAATPIWYGLIAPKGVPAERIRALANIFIQGAESQTFKEYLDTVGMDLNIMDARTTMNSITNELAANSALSKQILH